MPLYVRCQHFDEGLTDLGRLYLNTHDCSFDVGFEDFRSTGIPAPCMDGRTPLEWHDGGNTCDANERAPGPHASSLDEGCE